MNNSELLKTFTEDWLKSDNPDEVCNKWIEEGSKRFSYKDFSKEDQDKDDVDGTVHHIKIGNLEYEEKDVHEGDKKKRVRWVKGYASTTSLDRDEDEVHIDALKGADKQLKKGESTTVFFNHQWWSLPIGKVVESKVDEIGLFVKIVFVDSEDDSNEAELEQIIRRIAQGVIKTFSIGFRPTLTEREYEEDDNGHRRLIKRIFKDINLLEVSVVSIPANADAQMTEVSVKSFLSSLKSPDSNNKQSKQATPVSVTNSINKTKGKQKMDAELEATIEGKIASTLKSIFADRDAKEAEIKAKAENEALKVELKALKDNKDSGDKESDLLEAIRALSETITEFKATKVKIVGNRKGKGSKPVTKDDDDNDVDDDVDTDGGALYSVKELKDISIEDEGKILYKSIWCEETEEGKAYKATLSDEDKEVIEKVYEQAYLADQTINTLNS